MAVLDTRGQGSVASRLKWLTPENFSGVKGDGSLNLHGFDIRASAHTDDLRILLINHRPPFDPVTGEPLDATKVGANSTIEQFQTKARSDKMRHVRTYIDEHINTPNRVAWVTEDTFVFTNFMSDKVGFVSLLPRPRLYPNILQRQGLDPFIGGGNVAYCQRNRCSIATSSTTMKLPNGLVRGHDGLIYVPSTIDSSIYVLELVGDTLNLVNTIAAGLPIDNLSVDQNGDIFAAAFPQAYKWVKSSKAPFEHDPPTAVLRISRRGGIGKGEGRKGNLPVVAEYEVSKVMEDDGSVLPGSTVVIHDAQTGRYFLGGAVAPYVTICETREA